jgi:hypothetical protein
MIERIQSGNAPTTFEELEQWSFAIYDSTAGEMGGDTDLANGIVEALCEALGIEMSEELDR